MGSPPVTLMVGPVPLNPFRKSIIADDGSLYIRGTFAWAPRDIRFDRRAVPRNDRSPAVAAARAQEPDFDAVLVWARFPYWRIVQEGGGIRVTLNDARFPEGQRAFRASTTLRAR
jgi:hypothetical protein